MDFKKLTTITAFLSLINSIFYILVPKFSLMLLGRSATPIGLLNTQISGACALGMCAINWLSREIDNIQFQRIVITGNLIMFSILTIVEIQAIMTSAINWVGWLFVITDGLFTAGYAYLFKKTMG